MALKKIIIKELSDIDSAIVYGNPQGKENVPVISFNITGKLPSEVGYKLNQKGIYVRVGLHCSPLAHKTIGTFPEGTVRVAPGYFTSEEEVMKFLKTVREIAKK